MDSANSFDPRHRYYATIDVYIRFAIFWWNKNEFDRACQYVETSLKNCDMRDNRRAKLNYMLAHIYQFHIKKYKLSKKHYQTALKQNQTHGKSLFEYAYLLDKKLNNKQTAKAYYEKHIELIENHSSNIIEYDIDIKSPKLSIFIGDGTSFSHNGSFVFKPSVSGSGFALTDYVEPNSSGRMRTLSQSISISPKGHKHLSVAFASDDEGDLSHSEQLDIDLAGMDDEKKQQSPTQESSISVTSENNVKNGVEIDNNSTNNNNQKEKPVKYSSHANKLKNKSSSNKFGYVNLTLAPINSAASMGSESLKLSTSSRSRSKSYNKKFEDEESGIEIESGLDLHEAMDVEKENKEKKEKALLSLEAIEEENDLDTTIIKNNNKTRTRNGSNGQYLSSDDEDDIVLVGGAYLGAAIDEDDGVDIGGVGGYNTGYTSENEIDNTERTGIGTRSHNSDNSHTSHRSHRYRVKNKKKIAKESRLRLADIYASEGDNDNAKIQYDILLEHDPKNFGAILGYAHFLQYNLKDNESSEFHYQQAIELYTTSNIYLSKNIKVTKGIEMFVKYCDLLITEGKSRKIDVFQIIEKAKESIPIQMHNKLLLEFGAILYEDVDDDNLIYLDKAIECFKFIVDDSNNDTIDITRDRQYHYDAYLELGRIYHHYKNDLTTSYEYFQMALPLNHGKQDWHLHFELSMLMSDDDFIYKNIKRPFAIAKDHAQKSLDFCIDDQDRNELISIYKSLSLIHL